MRAIDADFIQDALTKTIMEILRRSRDESTQYVAMGLASIKTIIDIAPTLDIAPVRHGRWIWHEDDFEYECSACACRFDYNHTFGIFDHGFEYAIYCPNCGAKMDAGQEDEKND